MPHVSKNRLDKKLEQRLLNNFSLIMAKINKKESMEKFLVSLLSSTEQVMLAKRLGMFLLIKEGYSDTEIERMLNITRMTISKFRYFIDMHGEGFELASEALKDEKTKQEIHDFLMTLTSYSATRSKIRSTIL